MKKTILDTYIIYRIVWLSLILPRDFCYAVAKLLAYFFYWILKKQRLSVLDNIRYIEGWENEKKVKKLAIKTFQNFGKYFIDYCRLSLLTRQNLLSNFFELAGRENIEEPLKKKKGVILTTIHLGNWELGGVFLSLLGYPVNLAVLKHEEVRVNRIKNSIRQEKGIKVITIGDKMFSSIEIVSALIKNEIVGILGDRLLNDKEGVKVKFLNGYAKLPRGPVMLSLISGAPIVPCFLMYDSKQKKYKAIAESPIHVEKTGDRMNDVRLTLEKLAKVFEKYIREYPDQWYNFFPFCTKQ